MGVVAQRSGVMAADDLVDVVDDDDQVVRVATRAEVRRSNLLHRCVFVVVRSPAGDVLVHERSPHKDVWPSRWDLAVGGVLAAGESYDEGARREVAEEVGVVVGGTSGSALRHLSGPLRFVDADVSVLAHAYGLVHPGPFTFPDGEVVRAWFMAPGALRASVAAAPGRWVPDSVALVLPLVDDTAGGVHPGGR